MQTAIVTPRAPTHPPATGNGRALSKRGAANVASTRVGIVNCAHFLVYYNWCSRYMLCRHGDHLTSWMSFMAPSQDMNINKTQAMISLPPLSRKKWYAAVQYSNRNGQKRSYLWLSSTTTKKWLASCWTWICVVLFWKHHYIISMLCGFSKCFHACHVWTLTGHVWWFDWMVGFQAWLSNTRKGWDLALVTFYIIFKTTCPGLKPSYPDRGTFTTKLVHLGPTPSAEVFDHWCN